MPARIAQRLLIVGWDAADWLIVNRLFAAGKMPVLRRLVDAGCRADLGTLEPKLSPLLPPPCVTEEAVVFWDTANADADRDPSHIW